MALLLGAIGLYGILAFTVSQRSREIGIRLALGASPRTVRRQVIQYGVVLAVLGIIAGSLGAVWMGRVLAGILSAVGPIEPFALVAAALAFTLAALAGSAIPAWRAARTDPLIAMRE